jgi:prevent-host-death family protein
VIDIIGVGSKCAARKTVSLKLYRVIHVLSVKVASCSIYSNAVYCGIGGSDPVTRYSTSDLSRKSGDIIAEALRQPVIITQRNKPRLVLLNIEDYRRLTARADTRKPGTLETMSDALFEDIKDAVSAYEHEGDEV